MLRPVIIDKNEIERPYYIMLFFTGVKIPGLSLNAKRTVYTNVWVMHQDRRVFLKTGINYQHEINTIRYYCRKGYPARIITDCFKHYK